MSGCLCLNRTVSLAHTDRVLGTKASGLITTNRLSSLVVRIASSLSFCSSFHLQPPKELMANGFVHDEVVNELTKLVRALANSIKEKKKNGKKINKISNHLRMFEATSVDADEESSDNDGDNGNI